MRFFRKNTPIPGREVLSSIATVYHGVAPAVLTADLKLLKEALQELHSRGFKARELLNQADSVKDFIREADETTDLAVGMSSLGPLVYAVGAEGDDKGNDLVAELAVKYRGRLLGVFRGRNQGYEVVK
jgi:beta-ribofuranosylaminobenzene 5'-phosphate synthase